MRAIEDTSERAVYSFCIIVGGFGNVAVIVGKCCILHFDRGQQSGRPWQSYLSTMVKKFKYLVPEWKIAVARWENGIVVRV